MPALRLDDGTLLTEVVAIVQYLGDLRPESGLAPPAGTMARVHLQEWLTFISSEIHKVFSPWLWHKETAESTRQEAKARLALRFAELDRLLARQEYLLGAAFTVADAYAFTILNWSRALAVDLQPFPWLRAYMARVAARPKVIEALVAEGLLKKAA